MNIPDPQKQSEKNSAFWNMFQSHLIKIIDYFVMLQQDGHQYC